MAGEKGNKKAILSLVREYKKGHLQLAFAFPVAIFRGIFFLLICFEVASVLEVFTYMEFKNHCRVTFWALSFKIVMEPSDETAERIFFVAAIYIALIILKTIMEAVGVSWFCPIFNLHKTI
jgi:hypothetical protein